MRPAGAGRAAERGRRPELSQRATRGRVRSTPSWKSGPSTKSRVERGHVALSSIPERRRALALSEPHVLARLEHGPDDCPHACLELYELLDDVRRQKNLMGGGGD